MASAVSQISAALKGREHIHTNGLAAYHAALAFRNANLRVGSARKRNAAIKAVKNYAVRVVIDARGELELRDMTNTQTLFSFSVWRYGKSI